MLAMPSLDGTGFERSVIYLCSHDQDGAMGLVINRSFNALDFPGLLEQLDIKTEKTAPDTLIHKGGPVESGRGFVLHSADFAQESTLLINEAHGLTATVDILKAIADDTIPQEYLVALGYAGWSANQLESEIKTNSWMISDGNDEIIFRTSIDEKWPRAMAMLGIDITMLSSQVGHA